MAARHTGKAPVGGGDIAQLPGHRHRLAITAAVLVDIAATGVERLVGVVQRVTTGAPDRHEARGPAHAPAAGAHPVEPVLDRRVRHHLAEGLAIGRGQFQQTAQQRPPRAGQTLRAPRQFRADLDPVLEAIDRFVGRL